MTADEVCMQVRFDDVLYRQVLRVGFLDILIDVALRIDNGRFAL